MKKSESMWCQKRRNCWRFFVLQFWDFFVMTGGYASLSAEQRIAADGFQRISTIRVTEANSGATHTVAP